MLADWFARNNRDSIYSQNYEFFLSCFQLDYIKSNDKLLLNYLNLIFIYRAMAFLKLVSDSDGTAVRDATHDLLVNSLKKIIQ